MERGREEEARDTLVLIRGTKDINRELGEIQIAARKAANVRTPSTIPILSGSMAVVYLQPCVSVSVIAQT